MLRLLSILLVSAFINGLGASTFVKGHFFHFTTPEGRQLRAASWSGNPQVDRTTTIVLLHGRASFIEKHQELIEDLVQKGFDVKTFDWVGQGGSSRLLVNHQKGYVDRFETYLEDLSYFMTRHVLPHAEGKVVLVGSSLGGHLALRYLKEYPNQAQGGVLIAPMLDVVTAPYPRALASVVAGLATSLGFADTYAFGYGDYDPHKSTFEKNKETQSKERYEMRERIMRENPYFPMGGPTFQWVKSAFESMEKTIDHDYLQSIKEPILLMTAGQDKIVNNRYDNTVCAALPRCVHKVYKNAFHNISIEKDDIRKPFLNDLEDFITLIVEE